MEKDIARRTSRSPFQNILQVLTCIRSLAFGDLLRGAGHDYLAAAVAALGTEVDYMVRCLDNVEVVLYHYHRVAVVNEFLQHIY